MLHVVPTCMCYRVKVMVFNTFFDNISVILWQSVLLMEGSRVPEENHRQTLSHNVSIPPRHERDLNSQL